MGRVRVKKRLCRKDSFMGPSKLQQTRIDLGRATEASAVWSTGHALNRELLRPAIVSDN